MTKNELSKRVAEAHSHLGLHPSTIQSVIDAVNTEIIGALKEGQEVHMRGFGSFVPAQVKARKGWANLNKPDTRRLITIGARIKPRFRCSDTFEKAINGLGRNEKWPEQEFYDNYPKAEEAQ